MRIITMVLGVVLAATTHYSASQPGSRQAVSLLGTDLYAPETVSPGVADRLQKAKTVYEANPDDVEATIWYGRRIGYTGDYQSAIDVFSAGIAKHPDDDRLYRHRGHRYISVRNFDAAIEDLLTATELIEGRPNEIEPDGAPNARNIPVSTRHGNIWYHLGLAYYLKHDFERALWAYTRARESGTLPDNLVSTTHWIYMILRRLGRDEEAAASLQDVTAELDVIENQAYFRLCLFYRGLLEETALVNSREDGPQDAATLYGLANWYLYNDESERALGMMQEFVDSSGAWSAFGFIAAEADLAKIGSDVTD